MKVIFLHKTGPLIEYREGCLHIADLNPDRYLQWRVSRWKLLGIAWRSAIAAISR